MSHIYGVSVTYAEALDFVKMHKPTLFSQCDIITNTYKKLADHYREIAQNQYNKIHKIHCLNYVEIESDNVDRLHVLIDNIKFPHELHTAYEQFENDHWTKMKIKQWKFLGGVNVIHNLQIFPSAHKDLHNTEIYVIGRIVRTKTETVVEKCGDRILRTKLTRSDIICPSDKEKSILNKIGTPSIHVMLDRCPCCKD